ncbi:plastocyanin [Halorientalis persicus]|uniref:Plastocyanin n=1 Tax=Halorientalis persicus TaxID=1367881 RepID=A0A1H8I3J1_9EURY|nr:plastocyanin/azurin family copper-binding protein [Halorientalis persicus]SEN62596.1 plastocyanin [Halorientalis persicus]
MNRRTYLRRLGASGLAGTALTAPAAATTQENETSAGNQTATDGTVENGTAGNGTDAGGGQAAVPADGETYEVQMITESGSYYFDPVGLHVQPGDTVTFVNASGSHSAATYSTDNDRAETRRIPEGARSFNSGVFEEQGATFSYTFATEGTYDYYCSPHKTLGMVGRIVCGEPGGPATEGSIPDSPGSGVMPDSKKIVEEGSIAYPFVPGGLEPLPWQFWAGAGVFGTVFAYLLSKYDRESDRYSVENADNRI